jgi:hypothetical protein
MMKFGVFIEVFLFDSKNFEVLLNIYKLHKKNTKIYMYFGCS